GNDVLLRGCLMGWLVVSTLLGLPFMCFCIAVLARNRAQVENLQGVIRAQRLCMDNLELELLNSARKHKTCVPKQKSIAKQILTTIPDVTGGTLLGNARGYLIEPSAN